MVYVPLGCSVGNEAFGSDTGATIPWTYGRGPPLPPAAVAAGDAAGGRQYPRWLLVCGLLVAAVAVAGGSIVALRRCRRLQQGTFFDTEFFLQQGTRLEEDGAGATGQTPGGDTPEGPEYEKASTLRQPVLLRVIGIIKKAAPVSTLEEEEEEGQPPPDEG
eukprot:scaffold13722_cov55-Phaeocystis_antarctica.AAC.5